MNWPQAIYKIITEGGGGFLFALVILALFSDFFRIVFNRPGEVEVKVFPPGLLQELRDVIQSINEYNESGLAPTTAQTKRWARALEDAVENASEYLEDE